MHPELVKHLEIYRTQRNFNVSEWIELKVTKLNQYMTEHRLSACVIGCSGGVDSAVTFALCIEAKKRPGSPIKHVVPVLMPMNSETSETYKRALELCQLNGVTPMIDNIGLQAIRMKETTGESFNKWVQTETGTSTDYKPGDFTYGQLQSYLRTPHLYFTAQMMSENGFPAIVMGTGNKDEDGYLAYFCKAGDGVVDVQLINDLHKSDVFNVARALPVPKSIIEAKPTADLWNGQTDEEELGVSYDFVELFTGYYLKFGYVGHIDVPFLESLSEEARKEFEASANICMNVNKRNQHKLNGIVNL